MLVDRHNSQSRPVATAIAIVSTATFIAIIGAFAILAISFRLQSNYCLDNVGAATSFNLKLSALPLGFTCVYPSGTGGVDVIGPGWWTTLVAVAFLVAVVTLCWFAIRRARIRTLDAG